MPRLSYPCKGVARTTKVGCVCHAWLALWLLLLFSGACAGQTPAQTALSAALRDSAAVGVVVELASGRPVAMVRGQQAAGLRSEPGSLLKPFFLNAAIVQHVILPQTQIFCRRTLAVHAGGREWQLDCTHPRTGTGFAAAEALAYSCNRYFVELADRIPPAQVPAILQHFGIPLSRPPVTREEKELLVLGLQSIAVSPIEVALAYRKLALEWQPAVRDGLRDSVDYGMAHNAAVPGMELAGKTGTASHGSTSLGWFAGMGDGWVVVIFLPDGNGGDAARLAQRFFLHLQPAPVPAASSTPPSAPISAPGKAITVGVFTTATVKHLTVAPLTLDWKPDGIHTAHGLIKKLSLSGSQHLEANGHLTAVAAGAWTIRWKPDGIHTVLTLPSEDYVAAALNGEAAPDEPAASLQALAILIRTFAVVNASRHHGEGFNLCDSTHCQVLRLGSVRPAVMQAVHDTAGETLWFAGRQAHVYFTEHCGGEREAAANVWPAEHASYLQSKQPDPYCLRRTAATWQAHIPLTRLSAILRAQGWKVPSPVSQVRIVQRTATGRAQMLEVSGQGAPVTIAAGSFRFAIDRDLGWNQIRSNWYTAAIANNELVLDGKGYGHGAGLCQAGSYEMALEGRTAQEILSFYFPGAVARISPSHGGWQEIAAQGWTLLTTDPDPVLLSQGNAAWEKAQSLFGSSSDAIHPRVQELPTTELFRQTTAEPGWMLASTRGSEVFLQPASVREAHGGVPALLLHEFLHVLVEHASSDRPPLWLREGLVEVLSGERGAGSMELVLLDENLRRPVDEPASRRAHMAAAHTVALLCSRYGVGEVRNFLHNGVPPDALNLLRTNDRISTQRKF